MAANLPRKGWGQPLASEPDGRTEFPQKLAVQERGHERRNARKSMRNEVPGDL
jgi:hypothetical protein